jgi:hypothetical protein
MVEHYRIDLVTFLKHSSQLNANLMGLSTFTLVEL